MPDGITEKKAVHKLAATLVERKFVGSQLPHFAVLQAESASLLQLFRPVIDQSNVGRLSHLGAHGRKRLVRASHHSKVVHDANAFRRIRIATAIF